MDLGAVCPILLLAYTLASIPIIGPLKKQEPGAETVRIYALLMASLACAIAFLLCILEPMYLTPDADPKLVTIPWIWLLPFLAWVGATCVFGIRLSTGHWPDCTRYFAQAEALGSKFPIFNRCCSYALAANNYLCRFASVIEQFTRHKKVTTTLARLGIKENSLAVISLVLPFLASAVVLLAAWTTKPWCLLLVPVIVSGQIALNALVLANQPSKPLHFELAKQLTGRLADWAFVLSFASLVSCLLPLAIVCVVWLDQSVKAFILSMGLPQGNSKFERSDRWRWLAVSAGLAAVAKGVLGVNLNFFLSLSLLIVLVCSFVVALRRLRQANIMLPLR